MQRKARILRDSSVRNEINFSAWVQNRVYRLNYHLLLLRSSPHEAHVKNIWVR